MRIILLILFNLLFLGIKGQVTFVIESLPNTTPEEDTIFITGTFNDWNVNEAQYMLQPQLDGKYSITLPNDTGIIEFKFTRGSWLKVETDEHNAYISNRVFKYGSGSLYLVEIKNWLDLGGVKKFNYIILLLFAIAFYGIIFILYGYRTQKRNKSYILSFFLINICLVSSLIGAVIYNQSNLIWQAHLKMLGVVLFFVWGPILCFFLNSLANKPLRYGYAIHFIPAIFVVLSALFRYLNLDPLGVSIIALNANLSLGTAILILIGVFSNIIYHITIFKLTKWRSTNIRSGQNKLINLVYFISLGGMLLFIFNFTLRILGKSFWINNNSEIILIFLSIIIFIEFTYYRKYPEIFYNENDVSLKSEVPIIKKDDYFFSSRKLIDGVTHFAIPDEVSNEIKISLTDQMVNKKAYRNAQLNIAMLSEIIETKPHILSRVLNEQFNKSFRDFINEYRIQEFIELAASGKYKNYTLLALSFEVGFNSKSTFNLAFKKVTGLSPSNFLKNKDISLAE